MASVKRESLIADSVFYNKGGESILQGVYLQLRAGNISGLFGRNGSGKTTLMKILSGNISPSDGLVMIDGRRYYHKAAPKKFSKISFLPQDTMLPKDITVKYLLESFPPHDLWNDRLIAKISDSKVSHISFGVLRYLEISLVLSLDKKYFLLDEPFTALSPVLIEKVIDKIRKMSKNGKGILIADHYHQFLLPIVDEAYLMLGRQCKPLNNKNSFESQLKATGYLP